MKELFNKLFESDLLTEESKQEFKTLVEAAIADGIATGVAVKEIEIKAELAEQFVKDKADLIEALDTKTEEILKSELSELKEDLQRFRDLEVESAQKLVEAREEMAAVVQADMKELIETLDAFVEKRLDEEVAELKEELEDARKMAFGKRVFEAVAKEFKDNFHDENGAIASLAEAKEKLSTTASKLEEAKNELKAIKREKEMNRVLESLTDKPREVMSAILSGVSTDKLEETYNNYIGRVLHKSVDTKVEEGSEKENVNSSVLAEGNTSTGEATPVKVVTGDEALNEDVVNLKPQMSEDSRAKLKKLAGID